MWYPPEAPREKKDTLASRRKQWNAVVKDAVKKVGKKEINKKKSTKKK